MLSPTELENNTNRWNADAITKKKIGECGFRPIVRYDGSGDNGISGGMVDIMVMITNLTPRVLSTRGKRVDTNHAKKVKNKTQIL